MTTSPAFGAAFLRVPAVMRRALGTASVILMAACGDGGDPTGVSENGSVRGTVTDNGGAVVANASVELSGNAQAARTTISGADGVYAFADVPPGTYTLTVTPPSGFTVGASGTTSVTVARDAQSNPAAFVLERIVIHGGITGIVIDVDALGGVANALVALSGNGQAARSTNSGADGGYAFADLPPGTYALAVTPPAGFTITGLGTKSVYVPGGVQADASAFALRHDSCLVVRPDFGGPASAEDLALFAYDVNAPLNLQKTVQDTLNGVVRSSISYDSPAGGSVTGMMFEPVNDSGPRPGIVLLHGTGQNAEAIAGWGTGLATALGIVGIAIDAPFARRTGPYMRLTLEDRVEMIQLIKDLQRAVDVLRAHPNVDAERIAFHGNSYGGAMGALFVGVEHRLEAAVLETPDAGPVTHWTGPEDQGLTTLSCQARNAWIHAMTPIESIRFVPHATIPLLQQNGSLDDLVNPSDAQALHEAMPEPKTMIWYEAGHQLNNEAVTDRLNWLKEQLGIGS